MAESSSTSQKRRERTGSVDIPPWMSSSSDPLTEELQCSICLDVFTDPVTTPCGHNFCKTCLNKCWDNSQTCNCPYCKETFKIRPDLKINTTLRELIDHYKKKKTEAVKKPEVLCDVCEERKLKALKSCLVCQSSYCETHLEPHLRVAGLKKHKLINPVRNLEDYICQKHERPLELFCRDDQTCVCPMCDVTDHKNHNTVSLKETQLMIQDTQQMIQDRIKKLHEVKHSAEVRKKNTEKEKAARVELFTDLIRSIERCQTELLEMMDEQQKAAEKQEEELIEELEQEITELKMRNTELEQLSHTEDHLHLLQIYSSQCSSRNTRNWSKISMKTDESLEALRRALTQLKDTLQEKITQTVLKRMQQYEVDVTLDPDTANPELILSDDGKQVRHGDIRQKLPNKPERFDTGAFVLGKEGFYSGRFYFEVQVKGKTEWTLGVARESSNRKGWITASPSNGFWTVRLKNGNNYWACADPAVSLCPRVKPQRVGVFVDYEEGLVSFYDVESSSHIYSFTGQSFTEKLYSFFGPSLNYAGKNSTPLIITPVKYRKKSFIEETWCMIQDVQQMIQDRFKKVKDIKHSAEVIKRNTEKEKAARVELFTDLIRSIERCQTELLEMMEEQQKAAEKQEEELIEELEQEITELKMRNTELEQISHTEDHLHLLQIYSSLCSSRNTRNWSEISVKTDESLETLRRALTQLQDTLQEKLTLTVLKRMQQYEVDVTLDPDTAHPELILSNDGKQVRHGDIRQKLPDKPERFDRSAYVLGKEGFSLGRFYFEVQVKKKTDWALGVASESINRKGKITRRPSNGYWTVRLRNGNEYKACAGPDVSLCLRVKPQRVGVFVDYEEGLVSFYDVKSSSHIYSFTGQSFTDKLYPCFSPCFNDEGENSAPLIITPVSHNIFQPI
ncbi:E3 ubiquitin-protein ligase TRIM39-like [Ctenopharyngodon idella]|uniref:E3 ubiquitin-protein ligase TRIM39-like n=1 Tax=Ctenopharyngodon idella TaxID=7959 RepID=UPI0022308611|nr:E3 ubiquitin-protein ligase TRIM39-like [Ctenopharyngodon idella]